VLFFCLILLKRRFCEYILLISYKTQHILCTKAVNLFGQNIIFVLSVFALWMGVDMATFLKFTFGLFDQFGLIHVWKAMKN